MENLQSLVIDLFKTYGKDVASIIVLFLLGRFILERLVAKVVKIIRLSNGRKKAAVEKRAETLGHVIVTTGTVIIYIIVLLMVMRLLGVDAVPLLAGAGIIGLAIGFGSQSLIKDFVSGLFILMENQYSVGDRVKIGAFEGTVVKITMRSTVLKDNEGNKYYISNGTVNNIINYSQKD